MSNELLSHMRAIRRRVAFLNRTLIEDYRKFVNPHNGTTFFRRPTRLPADGNDVNSTPTCTALMSICLGMAFKDVYKQKTDDDANSKAQEALRLVVADSWTTAGLRKNNAFSAALTVRASAILAQSNVLPRASLESLKRDVVDNERNRDPNSNLEQDGPPIEDPSRQFRGKSIKEICAILLNHSPDALAVQKYPPTPTIAYWVCDAASMIDLSVSDAVARAIATWAKSSFTRHVSLVVADHHAMMDPVAMAMAGCLCSVLKRMARSENSLHKAIVDIDFPTDNELVSAIRLFFSKQNSAGVWEKYFPLFHYPAAGPNHCWHFEVLEAVINEFPEVLSESVILNRVERTLEWLERNRLEYSHQGQLYTGWNSGGDIDALKSGEPESWPTGVAHMCLARLHEKLSERIRLNVLDKYREQVNYFRRLNPESWETYLDCDLPGLDEARKSVKLLLEKEVVAPAEQAIKNQGASDPGNTSDQPRRLTPSFKLSCRRSGLLFGPPGTSKTSLAEAISQRLGWPFVELSPSDFLRGGLDGIYHQVNEVFEDLSDLYGVVILFDEMDALVQSRDIPSDNAETVSQSGQLDVTQKFLTTSMLPKLLRLRKQARTIFFMATNHQREFDPAIKRAGRFDLLIRMGPPSLAEKLQNLKVWLKRESNAKVDLSNIEAQVKSWIDDSETKKRLRRFSFGEMEAFFESLRREIPSESLKDINNIGMDKFKSRIAEWAKDRIVLCDDSKALQEFIDDKKAIKIQ